MCEVLLAMYTYAAFLTSKEPSRWDYLVDWNALSEYIRDPKYSLGCLEENAPNCAVRYQDRIHSL